MAIYAKAGDTFFTRSESALGRLIRWGEKDCNETTPAWTNHSGVVVEDGWIGLPESWQEFGSGIFKEAVVVEALWKTRKGLIDMRGNEVRVFRPTISYSEKELGLFISEANHYVGDTYGWWKLLGFLFKRFTCGKVDITKFYFIDSRPICSYLAAHVNDAARPRGPEGHPHGWPGFGCDPDGADPDSMLRFCEAHPEFWTEVK